MNDLDEICISIAGMPVTLLLNELDAPARAHIVERYAAFTDSAHSGAISVRLRVEPGPDFIPIIPGGIYQLHTTARDGRIEFESHHESGWVEQGAGQGLLVMRPKGEPENLLRVLYAWLCLQQNALLLHAAGVVREGRGFVFFGHSTSGKTTIARLSLNHIILSDDLVILKKHGASVRVYGVPFRGDMPEAPRTNTSAELDGLFTIVKDTEHRIDPVPAGEAIARLASCVPFVMEQPENEARVLEICRGIEEGVPVRALHFRRDPDFWRIIDGQD